MTTTIERTKELQEKKEPRPIDQARERLKLLSLEVKDLVEDGTFETVNDAIMETLYKSREHRTFNSFRGWKQQGKQVKKGEKAFLLWSKPKHISKEPITDEAKEENTINPNQDEYRFYGIAYLFSNAQVEDIPTPESEEQELEPQGRQLEPLPYE